jgi:phytoene dehydrogenase-like protein
MKYYCARTRRSSRHWKKYEPACTGLVLDFGLDCQYPQLAHHNFLFSGHQREHFETVFQKRSRRATRRFILSPRPRPIRPSRRPAAVNPPGPAPTVAIFFVLASWVHRVLLAGIS